MNFRSVISKSVRRQATRMRHRRNKHETEREST